MMTATATELPAGDWLRLAERTLPLVTDPLQVVGEGDAPALIIAPHPDDESLGCGGLIAALCALGLPPWVAVLTDGAASHPGSVACPPARVASLRRAELRQAVRALGLPEERLLPLDLPDGAATAHLADAAARLVRLVPHPGAILTSWRHDPHADHAAAATLAEQLMARMRPPAPRLLSYPVWGLGFAHALPGFPMPPPPLLPVPPRGLRLDVSAQLPAKRRAIAAHVSQTTRLIADTRDGFTLPPALLALADRPFETFLEA
jgi:LmbE family N-acetylglucosaminyl deacetylase